MEGNSNITEIFFKTEPLSDVVEESKYKPMDILIKEKLSEDSRHLITPANKISIKEEMAFEVPFEELQTNGGRMNVEESSQGEGDNSRFSAETSLSSRCNSRANNFTILDGRFFKIQKISSNKVVGLCVKCEPKSVAISGGANSSSNFLKHLNRVHGSASVKEYKIHLQEKLGRGKTSTSGITAVRCRNTLTQSEFERRIMNFFIHCMIPLKTVEDPTFLNIFTGLNISALGLNVLNLRTLGRKLDEFFINNENKIKQVLSGISYLCTTVDIWSTRKLSFLGETCHWIDPGNFQRVSVALACRRFTGSPSSDKIFDILSSIHNQYDIRLSNIVATVTDNVSNLCKAFKEFGIEQININDVRQKEIECEILCDDNECNSGSDESETANNISQLSVSNLLQGLPNHLSCSAHILILCATTDLTNAINRDEVLNSLHKSIMNKCNTLWKALLHPKSAEAIHSILNFTPSRPVKARWNSLYDAFEDILRMREKSRDVYSALSNQNILNDSDFLYISEFIKCTKPLAEALDILQSEKYCYFGCKVPTLVALRRKYQKLVENEFSCCQPIADSLLNSITTRFADVFQFSTPDSVDAGIAALCHPEFKKKWLSCYSEHNQTMILTAFKSAVVDSFIRSNNSESAASSQSYRFFNEHDSSDFFDFGQSNIMTETFDIITKAELHILRFFSDTDETFAMLHRFPQIKAVFLRYNTSLPSSAPVERLFSFDTMTNLPKSNRLVDKKLEERIMLKANFDFLNLNNISFNH